MEGTERERLLRQLIDWRPQGGVLSVYVHVDPADRSQAWRIQLRERLRALAGEVSPHGERRAFEAAAGEILERFPEDGTPPEGRGHVGFIELAEKRPATVWRSMQMPPRRTDVVRAPRPQVRPLVELFAEGPHVGVVLVSAERVRLLEWSLGAIRELNDWEITLFSRDWRERKAERSIPGPRSWTSASGHDQFGQRLDANRQRFLHEVGSLINGEHNQRRWRHIIAFGSEEHPRELAAGLARAADRLHVVRHDLVSAPESQVGERVAAEVGRINTSAALTAVNEVSEAIGAEPGTALGPQETLQALAEGRARHLVFDAGRDYDGDADLGYDDGTDGLPIGERLVELAVSTKADITPVYEEPAAKLEPHDGVAALLRY
jgi:Bacterial archaeo-eukaryotic release factor family 5